MIAPQPVYGSKQQSHNTGVLFNSLIRTAKQAQPRCFRCPVALDDSIDAAVDETNERTNVAGQLVYWAGQT
uniref:Uncharacterized protein n=1 Tax=Oryza glumipatula TaxID=40148 RepID=A0A0E0AR45_9ORYZ